MRLGFAFTGVVLLAGVLAGCGGGSSTNSNSLTPSGTSSTPTPTLTSTPNLPSLSVSTLAFTAPGTTATFTANETGYAGAFTAASAGTTSCTGIATFTPASANGPSATFTVTAVAGGQCQIVVSDTNGQSIVESIAVSTTTIDPQGRRTR